MKTVHGWAMPSADRFMSGELKPDGSYQKSHLLVALAHVTDWTVAIDGGAHIGTWSKVLSQRFARVIAVEPSRDTYDALTANMQRFGCANVECLNVAVGATRGFVTMLLDGKQALLANTGGRYVTNGGDIACDAIDDWHLPSLGFLKLDIEGSEVHALEGAAETLQRCKPIVLYENKKFWKRYGLKSDAPQTLLTSLGYRFLEDAGCDAIWAAS